MSAVRPYAAWFFFGAENVDEVNSEYRRLIDTDEDGFYRYDPLDGSLVAPVQVIAVDLHRSMEHVWFIRDGLAEMREAWMVRAIPNDMTLLQRQYGSVE